MVHVPKKNRRSVALFRNALVILGVIVALCLSVMNIISSHDFIHLFHLNQTKVFGIGDVAISTGEEHDGEIAIDTVDCCGNNTDFGGKKQEEDYFDDDFEENSKYDKNNDEYDDGDDGNEDDKSSQEPPQVLPQIALHTKFIPWHQRQVHPLPCIIDFDSYNDEVFMQRQPTSRGLLYVKIEKAASSTLASVAARTAHAIAVRRNMTHSKYDIDTDSNTTVVKTVPQVCRYRGLTHLWSKRTIQGFENRNHNETFLWTFVKDPTKRILSLYFFFEIDWDVGKNEYTGK